MNLSVYLESNLCDNRHLSKIGSRKCHSTKKPREKENNQCIGNGPVKVQALTLLKYCGWTFRVLPSKLSELKEKKNQHARTGQIFVQLYTKPTERRGELYYSLTASAFWLSFVI